ncbi:MAG: cellulase family glycosylhydrolase [Solirubrobacterales bacterium]|nr:cellulase family glycosylhydrolase [Solirubrobacterales bacterium]
MRRGILGLTGAALACALATTTAAAAPPAGFYGACAGALYSRYDSAQRTRAMDAMVRAGIGTVRLDLQWGTVEAKKGRFTWGRWDTLVEQLARKGITMAPIADYSVDWAQPFPYNSTVDNQFVPPKDTDAYARYAAAIAKRYGPGGDFWTARPDVPAKPIRSVEIWNEPNHEYYWQPSPSPSAYAAMYRKARSAIRAANPKVIALVGGLAQPQNASGSEVIEPTKFLSGMGSTTIDGVAVHAYGGPVDSVLGAVRRARTWMDGHGASGKPLLLNEWGFFPADGLSEGERADRYRQTAIALAGMVDTHGLTGTSPYSWDGSPSSLDLANVDALTARGQAYADGIAGKGPAPEPAPTGPSDPPPPSSDPNPLWPLPLPLGNGR